MATGTQGRHEVETPSASGKGAALNRAQRPRHTAGSSASGSFGATLRRYRLCLGWSQNALAKVVGLNASYINRLERGEREAPTRGTAWALAQALELSLADGDRLLCSAGFLPPSLQKLGPADSTVRAVVRILTDDRLSPQLLADFRAVVETIAYRWQHVPRCATVHSTRTGSAGQAQAGAVVTAPSAKGRDSVAATRCTQVAIRPNSVAPAPITGVGLVR